MSVCNKMNKAYAFMIPEDPEQLRYVRQFLTSLVGKIAQNLKFEHCWSYNIFKREVQNWVWDTMQATHIMDNRPGITGLKFQAYVQFGIPDYDSEVRPYLEGDDDKNANSFNTIDKLVASTAGRQKLLTYCGIDSLLEYRLAMWQMGAFGL
jgi:hypothetical protein